jgi:hypothetical protein
LPIEERQHTFIRSDYPICQPLFFPQELKYYQARYDTSVDKRINNLRDKKEDDSMAKKVTTKKKSAAKKTSAKKTSAKKQSPVAKKKEPIPRYPY